MSESSRAAARVHALGFMALVPLLGAAGCGSDDQQAHHDIYFVGYVYDGASGARLTAAEITGLSVKYRDNVIETTIETDGRFVTKQGLPAWQDFAVYIGATGYRPFVSRNPGIDVPASLAMTEAAGRTSTTQTFQVEARLFPIEIATPALTIAVEKSDALMATTPPPRASGTARLRPVSASLLEPTDGAAAATARRRWFNDEDLLAQTVTKSFTAGEVVFEKGSLSYGVTYELAIFDVAGYQPGVFLASDGTSVSAEPIVAGRVTSRVVTIQKESRAKLRILSTTMDACLPPLPSANAYGAEIAIRFSEPVEFVGTRVPEDIDNAVQVSPSSSTSSIYCGLKTSVDPAVQERGTRAVIAGDTLTLSFNPAVGFLTMPTTGLTCMLPPALTSVSYGTLSNVSVRPVGDDSRKKTLFVLFQEAGLATNLTTTFTLVCGARPTSTF